MAASNQPLRAVARPRPAGAGKQKPSFVEKTIAGIAGNIERAVFTEEHARTDAFLQRIDPRVDFLQARGIPFVALGRSTSGKDYSWIDLDFEGVVDAAYRFCRHEPGIDVVLTGTGNIEHLKQNVASINRGPLPSKMLAKLEELFGQVDSVSGN